MEETAEMLNDEAVEQMFVSTQQISVGLCTERALKRYSCSGLDRKKYDAIMDTGFLKSMAGIQQRWRGACR